MSLLELVSTSHRTTAVSGGPSSVAATNTFVIVLVAGMTSGKVRVATGHGKGSAVRC